MRSQDKFRGCLIGGAAWDALGYAVEFLREDQIQKSKYSTDIRLGYAWLSSLSGTIHVEAVE